MKLREEKFANFYAKSTEKPINETKNERKRRKNAKTGKSD